jgi:hypothetical protein
MPAVKSKAERGKYDIYPVFNIGCDKILRGLDTLAKRIAGERTMIAVIVIAYIK